MQHIEDNTEQTQYPDTEHNTEQRTEHSTETNNHAQNNAQPQNTCSTYDLHKYSFDIYHEQIAINNSNTIEFYTISKENI